MRQGDLKERTKRLALEAIRFSRKLPTRAECLYLAIDATAFKGLLWDRAMMVIAFQSSEY